jgi:hypothetical protein
MEEQLEEIVIDKENFANYFFDVRNHAPKSGQIMAKFTAVALFGSGEEKNDIVKLLLTDKARQAASVMNRIHLAKHPDCYRVCAEICEDIFIHGMTVDEVREKEYEFVLEAVYYTQREYVPEDDVHWETLDVLEYDQESGDYKSKIEL